ncbi:ParA family protein [Pontibacter beigongshangensis]|uniref:ParA family protein n=1 Tax=Pontibacter beigongshangensis TaxID=2574733 RepID=UPI0016501607|nr:ParA family protein [Pontibacter beigongshangensis]
MSKIVCIISSKSGVGRTTTTLNLGAAISKQGNKVLLVDMCWEANMTLHFNIDSSTNTADLLTKRSRFEDIVTTVKDGLDILPSGGSEMFNALELISNGKNREHVLNYALKAHARCYDYILINTSPILNLLADNALYAADYYMIVQQPEVYAYKSMDRLNKYIKFISSETGLKNGGVVITRFNEKQCSNLHRHIYEVVRDDPSNKIFSTTIRTNIEVVEAATCNLSVIDYAPASTGAKDYMQLGLEVLDRFK